MRFVSSRLRRKECLLLLYSLTVLMVVVSAYFIAVSTTLAQTGRLDPSQAENEAQGKLNPDEAELEAQETRPGGPEFAEEQPQQTPEEFEAERFAPEFRDGGPEQVDITETTPPPTLTVPVGDPDAPPPRVVTPVTPAETETPDSEGSPESVPAGGLVSTCSGTSCSACDLADLANNVIKWLIGIMFLLFAVLTTIAGFELVTSGGNSGALEAAKKKLTNGIIGIVIVLAAWLLVDTMMRGLIGNNGEISGYGPWSQIECGVQTGTKIDTELYRPVEYPVQTADQLVDAIGQVDTSGAAVAAGNCAPAMLQSMGMTASQANTFSCIAQAESGCDNNAANRTSSARGIFQITRGWNDQCHNLNLPACSAAVGVSGNLNCSRAFGAGGRVKAGMEALAAQCNRAASNQKCNVAAALCLYDNGGYGHWLGTKAQPHRKQVACVAKFAK